MFLGLWQRTHRGAVGGSADLFRKSEALMRNEISAGAWLGIGFVLAIFCVMAVVIGLALV